MKNLLATQQIAVMSIYATIVLMGKTYLKHYPYPSVSGRHVPNFSEAIADGKAMESTFTLPMSFRLTAPDK